MICTKTPHLELSVIHMCITNVDLMVLPFFSLGVVIVRKIIFISGQGPLFFRRSNRKVST